MAEKCLLTSGKSPEESEKIIQLVKKSSVLLKLLGEKIDREIDKDYSTDFATAGWAYKNAYELGYKKGLTKFLEYVKILP